MKTINYKFKNCTDLDDTLSYRTCAELMYKIYTSDYIHDYYRQIEYKFCDGDDDDDFGNKILNCFHYNLFNDLNL
jgi:hypothetical protein